MQHFRESFKVLKIEEDEELKINQYKITDVLGFGSYGVVRVGFDLNTDIKYAFKEFALSKLKRKHKSLDFVKREIAVMKKLIHPNIVKLYEILHCEETLFMVLELCDSGILLEVQSGKKFKHFEEDTSRHYFRQLLLGVEYLHFNDVIHCDIKPENLLLNTKNQLKIADFGVSKIFDKNNRKSTENKILVGSPAFMAPEMFISESELDFAVDIWTMGIVLFCMLFGELPFKGNDLRELELNIENQDVKFPESCNNRFCVLIKKLLSKDPRLRPKISKIRDFEFVTYNEKEKLPTLEENTKLALSVTQEDINSAFKKGNSVWKVVQAVNRFKNLKKKSS